MSTAKSSKSRKRKESNSKANGRKIHAAEARKKRACFIFCNYYTVPKCKTFHVKICFVCIRMKTNFHYKNFVRNFIFIMRFKATQTENSPILVSSITPCILFPGGCVPFGQQQGLRSPKARAGFFFFRMPIVAQLFLKNAR